MHDVCVIGAGWAGLSAASRLQSSGLDVVVLEKARGPGGRCSTRRSDEFAFDHGAQYFTARSAEFRSAVQNWTAQGLLASWDPHIQVFGARPESAGSRPDQRLVGTPGMNAVLKHLSRDLDCRFSCRVGAIRREGQAWMLTLADQAEELKARTILLTAPPEQSADLVDGQSALAAVARSVPMNPCWALMLGYEQPIAADFDAAFDNEGPLAWLARNASKPGRAGEAWLLHASAEWSVRHLEEAPETVAQVLLHAFHQRVPAAAAQTPSLINAHRWRYALAPKPLEQDCLVDAERCLVLAGDWCAGNRIEGAWLSGQAAAKAVIALRS
ncbi:MAG: NAD(P)/FAD-dependent oxidoreductase [Wenzhouxiangella sp.]